MTDRHAGYLITLDDNVREDDAEAIINALMMVKGVLSVQPVVGDHGLRVAEDRQAVKWQEMLLRVLRQAGESGPDSILPEGKP